MGEELEKPEKDSDMRCNVGTPNIFITILLFFIKATNDVTDRKFIYKLNKSGVFLPPLLTHALPLPPKLADLKKKTCSIKCVFHLPTNTLRPDIC